MAVRTVRVGPDSIHETLDGRQIPVVSAQRRMEAIARADAVCDFAGGTFGVLYGRTPTGIDGEMATTELLIHWRDRGDAKEQYEETVRFEDSSGVALFGDGSEPPQDDVFARVPAADDGVQIEYVAGPEANGVAEPAAV